MVKEFWQNTFVPYIYKVNLRACRQYTRETVKISKILSKSRTLSVFLRDRVSKNIT